MKDANKDSVSLNKYISSTGRCSRRQADKLIEAGRVTIDGVVSRTGNRVRPGNVVKIDGKPLHENPPLLYIALNKPVGIVCTTDRRERKNIIDFIGHPQRLFPIGRLDKPSEGLIFLTNDGDIVNKILRARNKHEKEYDVWVDKPINEAFLRNMRSGVKILDTKTRPCEVERTGRNRFTIILTQGLNRQIRRMCKHLGYEVTRLKRVRIMNVELDDLREGEWRELTRKEMAALNKLIQHSSKE